MLPGGGKAGPDWDFTQLWLRGPTVLSEAPGGCSAELGEEAEAGGRRLVALLPIGWLLQLLPILGLDRR